MVRSERVRVTSGVDVRVLVRDGGARTRVLLVHGLASNARMWDGVAGLLAEAGIGSVSVDLRGHGESDRPSVGFDFATISSDLASVMDACGPGPWLVVGQSWGGNVVLDLAGRRPDITALVLVDGGFIRLADEFADVEEALVALRPPDLVGVGRSEMEGRMRARFIDFPETGLAGQMANFEDMDGGRVRPRLRLESHLAIVRHLHGQDPDVLAAQIDLPVRVVAVGDPGSRPRVSAFAENLRRGEVTWVDGHHDIHAQRPELVADVIRGLA